MRIAYVKDAVYPWEKGGAQKRTWEIARRLADDHDVHLYGMHYWDGPPVIERDGVTLHGVCEPKELYVDGRRSIKQALEFSKHLFRPLMSEEFDIIDCQKSSYFPFYPSKASQLGGDSALVGTWTEVWGDYWYDYLGWKGAFGKAVETLTIQVPDVIIPISEHIERELQRAGRSRSLQVVHNGVDYSGIQDVPAADVSWDVLYVGRLSEHKNVDLLLEAMTQVSETVDRDVRCGIIGDGPERARLEKYADTLDVNDVVHFLGFVEDHEDVIANLKSAEVFVLPSEREGFPNTILEANACGVPCIISQADQNGGTAVVEDGENGYIVPTTANAFAEKISEVITGGGCPVRLRENAREFGKRHDWRIITEDTEQVYREAI